MIALNLELKSQTSFPQISTFFLFYNQETAYK